MPTISVRTHIHCLRPRLGASTLRGVVACGQQIDSASIAEPEGTSRRRAVELAQLVHLAACASHQADDQAVLYSAPRFI